MIDKKLLWDQKKTHLSYAVTFRCAYNFSGNLLNERVALFQIERCNYFLTNIVKTAQAAEPVDGRLVSFLLHVSIYTENVNIKGKTWKVKW